MLLYPRSTHSPVEVNRYNAHHLNTLSHPKPYPSSSGILSSALLFEAAEDSKGNPVKSKTPKPEADSTKAKPVKPGRLKRLLKAFLWGTALTGSYVGISYPYSYFKINYEAQRFVNSDNVNFKYYAQGKDGKFEEQTFNFNLMKVKYEIAFRIMEVLQDRPDLREALKTIPGGLEIRLYQTNALKREGAEHAHVGMAEIDKKGKVSMEFATQVVENNLELESKGNEVVSHELTHIFDYIDVIKQGDAQYVRVIGSDGYLPGWSDRDKRRFAEARAVEIEKIKKGLSPMDAYALSGAEKGHFEEFLAVLTETFFEKPQELKESNPELYGMMQGFFELDPASSPAWSAVKKTFQGDFSIDYISKREPSGKFYILGGTAVLLAGGGIYIFRKRGRKKAASADEALTPDKILSKDFDLEKFMRGK
ncbi:MAG: zinc-dependent peptidase [Cyanobacteria bacterium]|nr:zinc-dependent peptidase [Cyanobacteriota bacterium]